MSSAGLRQMTPPTRCGQRARAHVAGRAVRAALLWLGLFLAGPQALAWATPPTLNQPPQWSNNTTPSFSGTTGSPIAEEELWQPSDVVTVRIYASAEGTEGPGVQRLETPLFLGNVWTVGPAQALVPGKYTVLAEQAGERSPPASFTIDTTPPVVSITSPANGSSAIGTSQAVSGSAGTAEGDLPEVTVQLFAGPGISSPIAILTVPANGGSWVGPFAGLSPGTYTVRAEQRDAAGNVGFSEPVTFSLSSPPPPPAPQPPRASFVWFPSSPAVGETVTLLSSSTDASSPITAFAWAPAGNGPFRAGRSLMTTSFSTPGAHLVRLRVSAANGLTSVATETIRVAVAPLTLMQPFPIVRIAGAETSTGVRLTTLTVQAPPGARVTVSCQGRGCPARSESRVAASRVRNRVAGTVRISFRRFERALRAGVILRIRVSKPGHIGKYTRFIVRHGLLPERLDTCLQPAGFKPMACPSS
jgi:hypothetical protein